MLSEDDLKQFEKINKEDGWLGYASAQILIEEYRSLQQERKQMKEVLEMYAELPPLIVGEKSADVGLRARVLLQSLQGSESN